SMLFSINQLLNHLGSVKACHTLSCSYGKNVLSLIVRVIFLFSSILLPIPVVRKFDMVDPNSLYQNRKSNRFLLVPAILHRVPATVAFPKATYNPLLSPRDAIGRE